MVPAEPALGVCGVCAGPMGEAFIAREQHLGLGDAFRYAACADCGTVQLIDPPASFDRYYPSGYYSYEVDALAARIAAEPWRTRLARRWVGAAMLRGGRAARLARRWRPWLTEDFPAWLEGEGARLGLRRDVRVLDVGCGAGAHLLQLASYGFERLEGVDAFLAGDIRHPGGVFIRRGELPAVSGRFDLVMFHHSLEHMPEPVAALRAAHRLLAPGGRLLVRIPVLGEAWRRYREDWVQLDAPRHRFLFPREAFLRAAAGAGFEPLSVRCDSGAFQFWGSEQYRLGIALNSPRSWQRDPLASPFSPAQVHDWAAQAEQLNAALEGDQACFLLRRVDEERNAA
jgi:SAM-dependent methyltransferase